MDPRPPPSPTPAHTSAAVGQPPPPPHNRIAHAANAAAAAPPASQSAKHPPYHEMIYAAITALKEREGSSKRAIAKHIEKAYPELPSTHSALLTHHLRRLKNNGLLVMVKKSYKLPTSDLHNFNTTSTLPDIVASSPLSKRARGRPSKPKPNGAFSQQPLDPNAGSGLTDDPSQLPKKSPGAVQKRGRGRPTKTGLAVSPRKKSPGRPKKPKSISGPNAVKRGRGRPPKDPAPYATGPPNVATGIVTRPRGRPKKLVAPDAAAAGVGSVEVARAKRPGRQPKANGVTQPRKSSGRPVGRPKKNVNASMATSQAPHGQAEGYLDLKRKLEFFQVRVRQNVGVLKAQVNPETEISAVAAIQELEGLAAMDINVPWMEEPRLAPAPMPQH